MRLSDLVSNPDTGRLSHTKLWANVACAAATGMFVYQGIKGTLSTDTWLIYLGLVGGYAAALRMIAAWRGKDDKGAGHA
ncbi:hypothetical protein LH427_09640 [Laribacter hongkongensis]|uniref:hypothetical protein n=1 Tax=Laribacter hongkongensis TaxID=168471 RepID=UPI001EFC71B2|nr:hypothetical protein [Laribacter hongkongensis]MCG8993234.1 hypothetical protein [Laribacter hongkongensis]MCG8997947.1 hypothetical protein [Laribacter hongkongensis]MCG9002342.1 hypothetical protein [Laribacter hongkongensis]MCG9005652.1 hypothetical protein [Laribacter hongkongensis]MCG9008789.1 hypothetical protein [Laribacter hongkongensis]